MRDGWTLKDAAAVLGIHERRVTQSLDPTLTRIARLWRADPTRTMQAILAALASLDPMTPDELDFRERMADGRVDRAELHPSAVPPPPRAASPAPPGGGSCCRASRLNPQRVCGP